MVVEKTKEHEYKMLLLKDFIELEKDMSVDMIFGMFPDMAQFDDR